MLETKFPLLIDILLIGRSGVGHWMTAEFPEEFVVHSELHKSSLVDVELRGILLNHPVVHAYAALKIINFKNRKYQAFRY